MPIVFFFLSSSPILPFLLLLASPNFLRAAAHFFRSLILNSFLLFSPFARSFLLAPFVRFFCLFLRLCHLPCLFDTTLASGSLSDVCDDIYSSTDAADISGIVYLTYFLTFYMAYGIHSKSHLRNMLAFYLEFSLAFQLNFYFKFPYII